MDISDFCILCINLTTRPDRWEESEREFALAGLDVGRFVAVPNQDPIVGCAKSHFDVLRYCKSGNKHAMIFEDDVHFINNYKDIPNYIRELDKLNWDMLYLGANITRHVKEISDLFGQVFHAQSTHAYCVNSRFIDTILGHEYLLGKHMDLIYAENIIPQGIAYITRPLLAIQRPSYSDIEKRMVNYDWMEGRYRDSLQKG